MPSDFNADELEAYDLRNLAVYELKIRVGLAFDLLQQVREAVKHSAANLEQKRHDARTKKDHLKGQTNINALHDRSKFEAHRYNHNFSCIQTLRVMLQPPAPENSMEGNLRRIDLDADLKMINLLANCTAGDSTLLTNASWIWSVFLPPKDKRKQPERQGKAKDVPDDPNGSAEGAQWATQGTHVLAARLACIT